MIYRWVQCFLSILHSWGMSMHPFHRINIFPLEKLFVHRASDASERTDTLQLANVCPRAVSLLFFPLVMAFPISNNWFKARSGFCSSFIEDLWHWRSVLDNLHFISLSISTTYRYQLIRNSSLLNCGKRVGNGNVICGFLPVLFSGFILFKSSFLLVVCSIL